MKLRVRKALYANMALGLSGLLVTSLLASSLTPPLLGAEAPANKPPVRIVVLPVIDHTGARGRDLSMEVTEYLARQLAATHRYTVVPSEDLIPTSRDEESLSLRGELSPESQVKLGQSVQADQVAQFVLSRSNASKKTPNGTAPASLELRGQSLRVSDGRVAARVYARGQQSAVPTYREGNRVDKDREWRELVTEAVVQLVEVATLVGVIGLKREFPYVVISLGAHDGLRPGAEVEFFDDSRHVGTMGYGDAVEVDTGYSLIRVQPGSPFSKLALDTHVRPVYNPPTYAAGLTLAQSELRSERRDEVNFAIAVAVALIGIHWYYHGSESSTTAGGGTPPPPPPPPAGGGGGAPPPPPPP